MDNGYGSLEKSSFEGLYKRADKNSFNVINDIAEIVFESLNSISRDFKGSEDKRWHHALILTDIFERTGSDEVGITPLQQQLLIKISEKMKGNMRGMFPSLSAVILSVVGKYKIEGNLNSPYNILKRVAYSSLSNLQKLATEKPDLYARMLPSNITYDVKNDILQFKYRGGEIAEIRLSDLNIEPVDLFDQAIFSTLEYTEVQG